MKVKYTLKPWDEVTNHHFISRETWDRLANSPALEVELLKGVFNTSAMIYVKGEERNLANIFFVHKDDLRECVKKAPTNPKTEKTYTKAEISSMMSLVLSEVEDETEAIQYALVLGKLMAKFN